MSEPKRKTAQPKVYEMNSVSILVYLLDNGEFGWAPTAQTCGDKESAQKFLAVLNKMPGDKRQVWATRLDIEQAMTTCPLVSNDADISKAFSELCDTHSKHRPEKTTTHAGGEPNARPSLEKEFDEFSTAPDAPAAKPKTTKQEHGGETANGEK